MKTSEFQLKRSQKLKKLIERLVSWQVQKDNTSIILVLLPKDHLEQTPRNIIDIGRL